MTAPSTPLPATSPAPRAAVPASRGRTLAIRLFHSGAALLLLACVFAGFHRFYTEGRAYPGRELTPPIRTLVLVHGLGMTLWMLLAVAQPLLVALRNLRLHRVLGTIGGFLVLAIAIPGWQVGVASAQVTPPEARIWGLTAAQFMTVPLGSLVLFVGFVAVGLVARWRPHVHRPMMFLATLSVASAGVSRIDALSELYTGTVWDRMFGPFFLTLLLGGALFAVRCLLTRTFERPFAVGLAVLIAGDAALLALARMDLWASASRALLAG